MEADLSNATWTIEPCGDGSHMPSHVRGRWFPAQVPGCVHTDLIRAGIIGHPNVGKMEEACQWIGRTDWRYRCRFESIAHVLNGDRIDVVLDGLDTVAGVELNGTLIGEAMNAHHAHRFDAKGAMRVGDNDLVITLRGPISFVEQQEQRLGKRPVNGDWTPYCYLRKTASNFQWDWGPNVATCGIWRGARLESWDGARIAAMRPTVCAANAERACVRVCLDIETPKEKGQTFDEAEVRLHAISDSRGSEYRQVITFSKFREGTACVEFEMTNPQLWWPRGYGRQNLHVLEVALKQGGCDIDARQFTIGIRHVRLLTGRGDEGGEFTFEVNGMPVFCKGANWIPEGLFPADQSPQRLRQRIGQAAEANMNMLRVWGGGTYEQKAFYEECDRLGIMVWQDFMFACATYPEDEPYPKLIETEVRDAVSRLAHHPCIVLWCGGNENVLGYESWGWKQKMPLDQKWGERYYFDILPRVVKELDPSRPYWPDSPHSALQRTPLHPNDPDHGDRHTWDAKVEEYRNIVPRFCNEFGHQSPPCWATMNESWGADQLRLDSDEMNRRQRAAGGGDGGNDVWYGPKVMGGRWRTPRDFDEWLYQAHVAQARAMSIGIEWMRANQPHCMGALMWQLNDAWAGHSWSCVDSAGRLKPVSYAVRRSFSPRLLTIQPFDNKLRICAMNETRHPWNPTIRVRRVHIHHGVLQQQQVIAIVEPIRCWRSDPLHSIIDSPIDPRSECVVAEVPDTTDARAWWFFTQDAQLNWLHPNLTAQSRRIDESRVELLIQADALMRDAVIAVDRVDPDAAIDDNVITMMAGEQRALIIRTRLDVPPARWITPPVFCCANAFSESLSRM